MALLFREQALLHKHQAAPICLGTGKFAKISKSGSLQYDYLTHYLFQAYASFLQSFNWKSFVVIYENEESLVRLQEVLKFPKRYEGVKLSLHQLDPLSDDYRPMLKQIKNSTDTQKFHIILDCSFEKIERVLMNADEIGMINDYYNFFITSLVS